LQNMVMFITSSARPNLHLLFVLVIATDTKTFGCGFFCSVHSCFAVACSS
jgi:hypothetical protein